MRLGGVLLGLLVTGAILSRPGYGKEERPPGHPPATREAYRAVRNLVSNPSFEMDWMHNAVTVQTRFFLLEQSDWGYGQADGLPDCWVVPPSSYRDPSTARFGSASLRLQGTVSQVIYLCGETDPQDGGAHYNAIRPLPASLARWIKPRPLRFGVWCKTKGATADPVLSVVVEHSKEDRILPRSGTATFGQGTHDWEYREVRIAPAPDDGVAHCAVVRLTYQGQGAAWFDGVLAEEEVGPEEPNLLPNGGFESLEKGWPIGWREAVLWPWSRRDYYRFTGWSHGEGKAIGGARAAPLSHQGSHSLQLTALPGDNLAVRSLPVPINQSEARALEVSAWVRADNLRWLEVMAQDEAGEWLPQLDFAGFMGTDEQYRNRVLGNGSHDWAFVRKYLVPRRPVKQITLWLCARGFDGRRLGRNLVGTAWLDDVELRECGTPRAELEKRGVKGAPARTPSPTREPYRVVDLDLGERLWGSNRLRLWVQNPTDQAVSLDADYPLAAPSGHTISLKGGPRTLPARREVEVVFPYRLTELAADWRQRYRFEQPWPLAFGTPSAPVSIRLSSTYVYPNEKLGVGINLNLAQASLSEVASCRVIVRHPGGVKKQLQTGAVSRAFWSLGQERPFLLSAGHVDARNLIALNVEAEGLPVHAFTDPVRDCRVEVALEDRHGEVIARQASEAFGFLEKPPPPTLSERIERTEVVEGGTIRVNGRPFLFNCFPYAPTDLGDVSRLLNFPKTHKILPLPFPARLTFPPDQEAAWKKKVQDFVRVHKGDPKLFGYFFDHNGETTFWLNEWREMAECQRKVAAWAREVDPNHLLLSASWLFGAGALTPEAARHFQFLDVLDVEPALTWTPDCHAVRRAAGRPLAVVAGLECYYYQPIALLRWRVYEALRQGANGIGICPSGMLQPRPEIVGYLRGLHGEVEGLRGMLAGKAPRRATRASSAAVTIWERQEGKTRYLVAMLGDSRLPKEERRVTFTLAMGARKAEVLFEGRSVAVEGNRMTDLFEEPYTVRVYRLAEE